MMATSSLNKSSMGGDTSSSFVGLNASNDEIDHIRDLRKTDYFDKV
jgi:hypothetical protein